MNRKFGLLIFLVSFISSLLFIFIFNQPLDPDAAQYDAIAVNISAGQGFSLAHSAPFLPTMLREPLYPYLLSIIYSLFGHDYLWVKIFQGLLFSCTCFLTYYLARDVFGEKVAKLSSLLLAFCLTLANFCSYLLSELVTAFLLSLLVFSLVLAARKKKNSYFFIGGVILGLVSLSKTAMLLFLVIVAVGLFLLAKYNKFSLKKTLASLVVFTLAFFMTILPWVYRNYKNFATFQISLRGGAALWERAYKLDYSNDYIKKALVFHFSEYLGSLLFPGTVERPRDFILATSAKSHAREEQLFRENFTPVQIDRIMREEAVKKIKLHPIKFLIQTPLESLKMAEFIYLPVLNEDESINNFSALGHGRLILALLRGVFRLCAYVILALAFVGLWKFRRQWQDYFFPASLIVYLNIIYSFTWGLGRYAVPLIPFYLIFACAGFTCLFKKDKEPPRTL